jgi:hypothetical protein
LFKYVEIFCRTGKIKPTLDFLKPAHKGLNDIFFEQPAVNASWWTGNEARAKVPSRLLHSCPIWRRKESHQGVVDHHLPRVVSFWALIMPAAGLRPSSWLGNWLWLEARAAHPLILQTTHGRSGWTGAPANGARHHFTGAVTGVLAPTL